MFDKYCTKMRLHESQFVLRIEIYEQIEPYLVSSDQL